MTGFGDRRRHRPQWSSQPHRSSRGVPATSRRPRIFRPSPCPNRSAPRSTCWSPSPGPANKLAPLQSANARPRCQNIARFTQRTLDSYAPGMVRKELWVTLLGYNLIRNTTSAAALLHKLTPRQLSFTSACQYILAAWPRWSGTPPHDAQVTAACRQLIEHLANCRVVNRPGRIEPRVIKRRRHGYPLMQEPRQVLRNRLLSGNAND